MASDTEVENILNVEEDEDETKRVRPPSSYGSMKSESDASEEIQMEEDGEEVAVLPGQPTQTDTAVQMNRPISPETLYTTTTEQTKPPGAMVIDTRSSDLEGNSVDDQEDIDEDEDLICHSPEPPEPVELEDYQQASENKQPGKLHPEQDMPHVFKTIQSILSGLDKKELLNFKIKFYQWSSKITLKEALEGDILDFVDKMIELLGLDKALFQTIETLESVEKHAEAKELLSQCQRAAVRFQMISVFTYDYKFINEGIVRSGGRKLLEDIYVEPEISTCSYGGVYPSHEIRPLPPTPLQIPSPDTFVGVNDLFRLQKDDGTPVRTVVTTGIPGIGMTVSVYKFAMDWVKGLANRDLQFVITISFKSLWMMRTRTDSTEDMSIMSVINYCQPELKCAKFLEEESSNFLLIMDSFDRYQAPLDWENTPVINNIHTAAPIDVLTVNIVRGDLIPGARKWILGRQAAVSQIPSKFIDLVTEIQGFNNEMKDDYHTRRIRDAHLAEKIVRRYKLLPTLHHLCRHPLLCWLVSYTSKNNFRYLDYGTQPPRLTPYLVDMMVIQMNRRLEFYYDHPTHDFKWSNDDCNLLRGMGKMALKMLEKNKSVFVEEDLKPFGLPFWEVVVSSGWCAELHIMTANQPRTFSFIDFSIQEFLAALHVFLMFHKDSKNILDSYLERMPKFWTTKYQTKSAAGLVQCALALTLSSPLGQYDMFLRYLCGMMSPSCHAVSLRGYFYNHHYPEVKGIEEVQQLLEFTIQKAPENRVENLKECLREAIQADE
ncbi:NLR family CARD domain-containing protein 3 isoform 1-T2 [Menidia menidia]